ncbi:hypothetical protein JAAARDRAFT_190525 [Jaapia argillacea MUCL 33604]|uniref:Uncharacterized protein n=1 Tax=Jaapia argillacea MUCL 33604 TaxID=933084 RepID=A0A067Q482_9AGAM|nr:hypothetical protein JAAARDRAFT_190525 [Jaapia argillacea MUCL 33604]
MASRSRQYIDLILQALVKWPNWDPSHQIYVGDYGVVDKETGALNVQGNIYNDSDPLHVKISEMTKKYPPEEAEAVEPEIVSKNVSKGELQQDPGTPGVKEAEIKGTWKFNNKPGALLLMAQPQTTRMPKELLVEMAPFKEILEVESIVTEVTTCPAYSMYFSNADGNEVSLSLIGKIPTDASSNQSTLPAKWWSSVKESSSAAAEPLRQGCDSTGLTKYTPLFAMKRRAIRKVVFRDLRRPIYDEPWVETRQAWEQLDDAGEEIIWEDPLFTAPDTWKP